MISLTPAMRARNRIHQHRRGIRRRAARHIDADAVKAADPLAHDGTVRTGIQPALLQLAAMKVRDIGSRAFERGVYGRITGGSHLGQPLLADRFENRVHSIELPRVVPQGVVSASAHGIEYGRNGGGDFPVHFPAAGTSADPAGRIPPFRRLLPVASSYILPPIKTRGVSARERRPSGRPDLRFRPCAASYRPY